MLGERREQLEAGGEEKLKGLGRGRWRRVRRLVGGGVGTKEDDTGGEEGHNAAHTMEAKMWAMVVSGSFLYSPRIHVHRSQMPNMMPKATAMARIQQQMMKMVYMTDMVWVSEGRMAR